MSVCKRILATTERKMYSTRYIYAMIAYYKTVSNEVRLGGRRLTALGEGATALLALARNLR